MPPKVKVSKEDIINKGVELVKKHGQDSLNARALAKELKCSTQPIFSNFESMGELIEEVTRVVYEKYLGFIKSEVESGKYAKYKAFGMAYIRFAKDEKNLFKMLFMCDREGKEIVPSMDFELSVEMIMKNNGVDEQTARLVHLEMWAFVHGIASMLATSFTTIDWEVIEKMVTDVYQGVITKKISEGNN